jgi:hypothetical protein
MATGVTVTDDGLEWIGDKTLDSDSTDDENVRYVAVGTDSTTPASGDSNLGAEVHRQTATFNESNATGGYDAVITISGGTEVSPGTTITELGIFAGTDQDEGTNEGILLLREVISGVTVEAGHREQFTIPLDFST